MFRKIRRKEKQLTVEECNVVLTKAEFGTLATLGADGYPYAVPVNYVFHNGHIYFHCATVGHKPDNISNCPSVSFNVVTDVWANEDEYSKYKKDGIKYIESSLKRTKLIKIEIEHMTGKRGIQNNRQIQGKQN